MQSTITEAETKECRGCVVEHIVNTKSEIEKNIENNTSAKQHQAMKIYMVLFRKHLHTSQRISPSVCLQNAIPKTFSGPPRCTLKSKCTRPRANTQKRTKTRPEANAQRHHPISVHSPFFLVSCSSPLPAKIKVTSQILPFGANNN